MASFTKKSVLGDSTNTYTNFPTKPPQLVLSNSTKEKRLKHEPGSRSSLSSLSTVTPSSSLSTASSTSFSDASSVALSQIELEQYDNNQSFDTNDGSLNSLTKNKKKVAVDDTKYKTELCKNWMEVGKCNYGKKCKFAHGRDELVEKFLPTRGYKSKKCNSFFTKMFCPYGVRCMFAHEQRTLDEINCENYYQKFLSFPELIEGPVVQRKTRLPVFQELSQYNQYNNISNNSFKIQYVSDIDTDSELSFEGYYSFGCNVYSL